MAYFFSSLKVSDSDSGSPEGRFRVGGGGSASAPEAPRLFRVVRVAIIRRPRFTSHVVAAFV